MRLTKDKMRDLISVIIPIYNSQQYIYDCIKSIQKQTYSNIEILMIDDGSEDNSENICKEIAKTDHRIRILTQIHKGVSAARNAGIRAANGKYLFFLDSDDMIHPELLETFYELLEKSGAVIAMGNYCREIEWLYGTAEGGIDRDICSKDVLTQTKDFDKNTPKYMYLENKNMMQEFLEHGAGGIGGKMIRSTALKYKEFDEDLIVGEDTKLIYQLIAGGADAVILYKNWYYYRRHKDNASEKCDVESIRSIYKSVRYICDKEKEGGRLENAVWYEEYIVKCIVNWKIINRKIHDQEIAKCLKEMMYNERRLYVFSKIHWYSKKDFYCILFSYPLFVLERKLCNMWKEKKEIWLNKKKKKRTNEGNKEKVWKSMEKVSVIIPMYNSEGYINRCIRSVINQSYSNLEIIVINDGSTDGGLELCKKLGLTDERIRIFSQGNEGVAKARNKGMDMATGKYLFFLDSDDAIHPLLLEELVWQMEDKHADIGLCEYAKLYAVWMENVLKKMSDTDVRPQWKIIEGRESVEWFHKEYYNSMIRVGLLIRKDTIGALRFDTELSYGNEALFLYNLLYKRLRIAYSTQEWYYHRLYSNEEKSIYKSIKNERYFDIYKIIRDKEYQKYHVDYALLWERRLAWNMRQKYILMIEKKYEEQSKILRNQAITEMKHPLYKKLTFTARILFYCCFFYYPLYSVLRQLIILLDKVIWFIKRKVYLLIKCIKKINDGRE